MSTDLITFDCDGWKCTSAISRGTTILEETPILSCPMHVPQAWKKLAKKIGKIVPDPKPDECPDTLPPWSSVVLNEALVRLLYGFDTASVELKRVVLELYVEADSCVDSPFDSLVKKAKALILKEAAKIGVTKITLSNLDAILCILTRKVCVTTDGGAVLFRKLGSIQHSCMPNCMFIPRSGGVGHLVAIREILVDELISCSHIPTNCLRSSVEIRQSWLRGVAGTSCRSDCCTVGFDVRRRVVCPVCPSDCFAAKDLSTGKWIGETCKTEFCESDVLDVQKEANIVKKIIFLSDAANLEFDRLYQFTRAAILEAIRLFGKKHFAYHQLLLLEAGLVLHTLSRSLSVEVFKAWIRILEEIHTFSTETKLPFDGMDELVRILITLETMKMAVNILSTTTHTNEENVAKFSELVNTSYECLLLLEGPESSFTSDGLKLRNWWNKKYLHWKTQPVSDTPVDTPLTPSCNDTPVLTPTCKDTPVLTPTCKDMPVYTPTVKDVPVATRNWLGPAGIALALGASGVAAWAIARRFRHH